MYLVQQVITGKYRNDVGQVRRFKFYTCTPQATTKELVQRFCKNHGIPFYFPLSVTREDCKDCDYDSMRGIINYEG